MRRQPAMAEAGERVTQIQNWRKPMSNEEVIAKAEHNRWDNYVVTLTGRARRLALIFLRLTDKPYEDIQFCTVDDKDDPLEWARRLEVNWSAKKTPGEEDIRFLRWLQVPGLGTQHIMVRLAATDADGELFRCSRCGCTRKGNARLGGGNIWSPYVMRAPTMQSERRRSRQGEREADAWREFHAPCPGE